MNQLSYIVSILVTIIILVIILFIYIDSYAKNYFHILFVIVIIIDILSLVFLHYILNYLNELRDNEVCDKLNQPYLDIYYSVLIFYITIILLGVIYLCVFGSTYVNLYILRYKRLLFSFNLLLALSVVYLLYNISSQETCKDIQPNFRIFLFIYNMIKIIYIINKLFFKKNKN